MVLSIFRSLSDKDNLLFAGGSSLSVADRPTGVASSSIEDLTGFFMLTLLSEKRTCSFEVKVTRMRAKAIQLRTVVQTRQTTVSAGSWIYTRRLIN